MGSHRLRIFDQGADHVNFMTLLNLLLNHAVKARSIFPGRCIGFDSQPAGRHIPDFRDIQITVQDHGQGSGDGGRRHDQNMGHQVAPARQQNTLPDAEPVLFIGHAATKVGESNIRLQYRVGTYQDIDGAVLESGKQGFSPGCCHCPCQESDFKAAPFQESGQSIRMLTGQNGSGRHHDRLVALLAGCCHGQSGNHCLTGTDIALKKPVGRFIFPEIVQDGLQSSLLGRRQFKGEPGDQTAKPVFACPANFHDWPLLPVPARLQCAQAGHDQKEFLKGKPPTCHLHVTFAGRKMDTAHGEIGCRQFCLRPYALGQGFLRDGVSPVKHRLYRLPDIPLV